MDAQFPAADGAPGPGAVDEGFSSAFVSALKSAERAGKVTPSGNGRVTVPVPVVEDAADREKILDRARERTREEAKMLMFFRDLTRKLMVEGEDACYSWLRETGYVDREITALMRELRQRIVEETKADVEMDSIIARRRLEDVYLRQYSQFDYKGAEKTLRQLHQVQGLMRRDDKTVGQDYRRVALLVRSEASSSPFPSDRELATPPPFQVGTTMVGSG